MSIDFHAHILPKADHGCTSVEVALQQLELAHQAGIDTVIATPHFYSHVDSCEQFLIRREACAKALRQRMPHAPKVLLGAEVQLCRGLERVDRLHELCVEGTNVLLLELPPNYSAGRFDQTIDSLIYGKGLKVVLAHIDRYPSVYIDFLLELGCLAQINAAAFCHFRSVKQALRYAESESIVALGSDIHGTAIGYSELLKAKKRLGSLYDEVMQRTHNLLK